MDVIYQGFQTASLCVSRLKLDPHLQSYPTGFLSNSVREAPVWWEYINCARDICHKGIFSANCALNYGE